MDFQQIRDFVNPAVAQATGLQEVDNLQMPVPVAYVPIQIVIDGALSLTSENPVQNKVIAVAIQNLDGRITAIEGQFSEGVTEAVNNWLAAHPEATTTVQDGAITYAKLDANLKGEVDQISDLKSALNAADDLLIGDGKANVDLWESGSISGTGGNSANSARIRTKASNLIGVSEGQLQVTCSDGYEMFFPAYNSEGVYVGRIQADGNIGAGAGAWLQKLNFIAYSNYRFRIVLRNKIDTTAQMTVDEASNVIFFKEKYADAETVNNEFQAITGSYKIHCSVLSGSSNAIIKIPLKTYAGGTIQFNIINENSFPSGITFRGYQVRNDANSIVITTTKRNWVIEAFDSEYITIAAYFASAVESDYTFDVEISFMSGAVYDILSNIIGIGTHTQRYEGFSNFNIYGINKTGSVLVDDSGNYETPPIEISGGHISGLTIKETGGVTEHSAYCIHTDSAANINNSLVIEDCYIESNSSHCMGVGTRMGYDLTVRNCIFKATNNAERDSVCVYVHNSNNGETTGPETASHITFIGCTFISDSSTCIKLQDWRGNTIDYVEFTFIDCTFSPASGNIDDSVYIEYRSYTPEEYNSHEFKNKFSIAGNSVNNNVTWLNATHENS